MTTAPKEKIYSGVVDHENVRITLFLAELNDLNVMAADIGNAYLHGITREKSTSWPVLNLVRSFRGE